MDTFVGFISAFPYDFPPAQWARCQGQLLSVGQYNALFSLLGANFGGDARSNFGLPDLQTRQIIGAGTSHATGITYRFAQMGGVEQVTLSPSQAPLASHTHPATFTPSGGGSDVEVRASTNPQASSPVPEEGSYLAAQKAMGGVSIFVPGTPTPTTTVALGGVSGGGGGGGDVTVDPNTATPAQNPVPVMNPYLALNFCIALEGIYPSRN